jgi:hypothetical protein
MSDVGVFRSHLSPDVQAPKTLKSAELFIVPDDLENRIDHQAMLLHTAATPAERRAAWCELTRLHGMRSPARVEQLENAAGLR